MLSLDAWIEAKEAVDREHNCWHRSNSALFENATRQEPETIEPDRR